MPGGCVGLHTALVAEQMQLLEKPGGEKQLGEFSVDEYIFVDFVLAQNS